MATDNEKIVALEHRTWQALQRDGKDLLQFLSHDCIMLFPLGMKVSHNTEPDLKTVMTSEAFIPWETYRLDDVAVTPVGTDGAVISYKAEAERPGMEEPFRALISSTWRKEASTGEWLLCVHQQTPYQPIDDILE